MRKRILQRDSYRCRLRYSVCLGDATEVDHIVNMATILAAGGTRQQADDPANLQSVCRPCHAIKTERERVTPLAATNTRRAEERRARLGRKPHKHPGDD